MSKRSSLSYREQQVICITVSVGGKLNRLVLLERVFQSGDRSHAPSRPAICAAIPSGPRSEGAVGAGPAGRSPRDIVAGRDPEASCRAGRTRRTSFPCGTTPSVLRWCFPPSSPALSRDSPCVSLPLFSSSSLRSLSRRPSADWPQWRGPNRDGAAPTSPPLVNALPAEGLKPVVDQREVARRRRLGLPDRRRRPRLFVRASQKQEDARRNAEASSIRTWPTTSGAA